MSHDIHDIPGRCFRVSDTTSLLDSRGGKTSERVSSEYKYYAAPSSSTPSDQMLASTSQILTEPPSQIKKHIEEHPSTSIVSEGALVSEVMHGTNMSMMKERVILACHRCDYKTFHRHALDRHIQVDES